MNFFVCNKCQHKKSNMFVIYPFLIKKESYPNLFSFNEMFEKPVFNEGETYILIDNFPCFSLYREIDYFPELEKYMKNFTYHYLKEKFLFLLYEFDLLEHFKLSSFIEDYRACFSVKIDNDGKFYFPKVMKKHRLHQDKKNILEGLSKLEKKLLAIEDCPYNFEHLCFSEV